MERLTVETNRLIARLAADCSTVGRLPAPWRRSALWLMCVGPCVAIVSVHVAGRDVMESIDNRMVVEQAAILLTGLTAALAAFSMVVRGVIGGSRCCRSFRSGSGWAVSARGACTIGRDWVPTGCGCALTGTACRPPWRWAFPVQPECL